ncbi:aldo/keto reductase [Chryseolinea sp. T2]|uniref:aldo/keto reductase n=1 Tax=Chryseolinea sp. T2 TaxID=3129255 RepID=UPI0030774569
MNRRSAIRNLTAAGLAPFINTLGASAAHVVMRTIPSSGEKLPAVGLGTWRTFDVGDQQEALERRTQVLKVLVSTGGSVVDSSPMYGRSESVVGKLSSDLSLNDKLFIATKVWTSGETEGREQMEKSFSLLRRQQLDLMQVHNLVDWKTHLPTLHRMKDEQRIRYVGITHYLESAYDQLESIMRNESIDFLAVNYSAGSREAERRLLPLAGDKGIAVIINRPFEEGALFNRVAGRKLPVWADTIHCYSWAQLFLKYILSNPAVTCVIPGTTNPSHMQENINAADGIFPDAQMRAEIIKLLAA